MKRIGIPVLVLMLSAATTLGQSKVAAKAAANSRRSTPGSQQSTPARIDSKYTARMVRQSSSKAYNPVSFSLHWNSVAGSFLRTAQYSNNLSSRPSYNFQSSNPEVVVATYQRKVVEMNRQIEQQTAARMAQAEREIQYLNAQIKQISVDIARARGKSGDGVGIVLDVLAIAGQEAARQNLENEMAQVKYNAQRELEAQLAEEMGRIKDDMVGENEQLAQQYFEAAAYEVDPGKEHYFMECRNFHICVIDQVEENYSIHNANWINTSCNKPGIFVGTP